MYFNLPTTPPPSPPLLPLQVVAFAARTGLPALDSNNYTGILSYEPRFKSDIPKLVAALAHSDIARPAIAITHPRNGSSVAAGAVVQLEVILLNIMQEEVMLAVTVDGDTKSGAPNLHHRNVVLVSAPQLQGSWLHVDVALVRSPPTSPPLSSC